MFDLVVVGGIFREVLRGDGTEPSRRLAGSGITASVAASRFGAQTALVSYVGDEDAELATVLLDSAGVDVASVMRVGGVSGTFVFPTAPSEERPWPMYRPADSIPVDAPPLPQATTYLIFGFPGFDAVTAGWLSSAPPDSSLLWDRQGWLSKARDSESVSRLPPHNKIYLANLSEAKEEYGYDPAPSLLATMPPPGFDAAVIKMASAGVTVVQRVASEARCEHILGFPVETPAAIGSGDVLAGVTAACLANGDPLGDAIAAGNAAAATYLAANCDPFASNLVLGATELLNTRR